MAERKTAEQVAQEDFETAKRVHEKTAARLEKLKADVEKTEAALVMAERRMKAARFLIGEESDVL